MESRTFEELLTIAGGDPQLLRAMAQESLRILRLFDEAGGYGLVGTTMTEEECILVICPWVKTQRPDPLKSG